MTTATPDDAELLAMLDMHLHEIRAGHDHKLYLKLLKWRADSVQKARLDELEKLNNHYWDTDDTDTFLDMYIEPYVNDRITELTSSKEES